MDEIEERLRSLSDEEKMKPTIITSEYLLKV